MTGREDEAKDGEPGEPEETSQVATEREDAFLAAELDEVIVSIFQEIGGHEADNVDEYAVGDEIIDILVPSYDSGYLQRREILSDMSKILSREAYRIMIKHYLHGYSFEEIARQEGRSAYDLRRLVAKSREILRRAFNVTPSKVRPYLFTVPYPSVRFQKVRV